MRRINAYHLVAIIGCIGVLTACRNGSPNKAVTSTHGPAPHVTPEVSIRVPPTFEECVDRLRQSGIDFVGADLASFCTGRPSMEAVDELAAGLADLRREMAEKAAKNFEEEQRHDEEKRRHDEEERRHDEADRHLREATEELEELRREQDETNQRLEKQRQLLVQQQRLLEQQQQRLLEQQQRDRDRAACEQQIRSRLEPSRDSAMADRLVATNCR